MLGIADLADGGRTDPTRVALPTLVVLALSPDVDARRSTRSQNLLLDSILPVTASQGNLLRFADQVFLWDAKLGAGLLSVGRAAISTYISG